MRARRFAALFTLSFLLSTPGPAALALPGDLDANRCGRVGGCEAWAIGGASLYASEILAHPDGSAVYVAHAVSAPYVAAHHPATGALLWKTPLPMSPHEMTLTPDGLRLLLVGRANAYQPATTGTAAVDAATGALLWSAANAGASGNIYPYPLAVSADSSRVATIELPAGGGNPKVVLRHVATGVVAASWAFGAATLPTSIAFDPTDGRVYAASRSYLEARTLAGAVVWGVPVSVHAPLLRVANGAVYEAGTYEAPWPSAARDFVVEARNGATGALLFRTVHDPVGSSWDWLHSATVSPDRTRLVFAGSAYTAAVGNVHVVASVRIGGTGPALGTIDWSVRFPGAAAAPWPEVQFEPDQRRLLLATSTAGPDRDAMLRVLAPATGAELGAVLAVDPGNEAGGSKIEVAPRGERFYLLADTGTTAGSRVLAYGSDAPGQRGALDALQSDGGIAGDAGDADAFPTHLPLGHFGTGDVRGDLFTLDDTADVYAIHVPRTDAQLAFRVDPHGPYDLSLKVITPAGLVLFRNEGGPGMSEEILVSGGAGKYVFSIEAVGEITLPIGGPDLPFKKPTTYTVKGNCYPNCGLIT